ncbi:MAG: tetratricopeptide repeat protein [Myxococcota bacterium]
MSSWSPRRAVGLATGLVLVLGVAAVYAPSLGNDFVHDDHEVIEAQPRPAHPGELVRVFFEPHFEGLPYYRPVTRATLLLQLWLHGPHPAPFRAANALLMGLAALLACGVLRSPALGVGRAPALAAAALFGLHPVASSCVYPVASGRETLMPAVLLLGALAAWLRDRRGLAFAAFGAALFAKEQAVVMPGVFLLADALGLGPGARPSRAADWARRYAPLVPIVLVYALARHALFGGEGAYALAVLEHPEGPLLSLFYGLQVAIAPFHSLVYEPELQVWGSWPRALGVAAVCGASALAVRRLGAPEARVLVFWTGFFVLVQMPTANWLEQEARFAERYAFLALLAPLAVAAGWATRVLEIPRARPWLVCATALALFAAATVSVERAGSFRDDESFARRWLANDPESPDAHHLLGLSLVQRGRPGDALPHYRAALRASPDSVDIHHNLGTALALVGRRDEAVAQLREALARNPEHPEALVNLGQLLAAGGQLTEAEEAYRSALRVAPREAAAHNSLGVLLARRGALDEAATHFAQAVRLRPDHGEAWRNLGLAQLGRGDDEAAAAAFRNALAVDPGDGASRARLRELERREREPRPPGPES